MSMAANRGPDQEQSSPPHERIAAQEELFDGRYGRLRDVQQGPDGQLYVLTSNRDGRGDPDQDDDRVLRIWWK